MEDIILKIDTERTDFQGNKIFTGKDSIELEIIGVGSGKCDILIADNVYQIYNETNGYIPLDVMLERKDIKITSLIK